MEILSLQNIKKSFGPVQALKGVDLSVQKGHVHALIGENGAGKSTLMKILSGAYTADGGTITFKGAPYKISTPSEGRKAGIAMIYQELTLAPHLSVAENISLGIEHSKLMFMTLDRQKIKECLSWLGHPDLDLDVPVKNLPISIQQILEIARALYSEASVIIMDEPTSSLTRADTEALFKVIKKLKEKEISIIYISHFLEEVKEVSDSYSILRDGESVAHGNINEISVDDIVRHMVGRSMDEMYPVEKHEIGDVILDVQAIEGHEKPESVSFKLRRGEILGIAGLVGSGRTETLRGLFGLDKLNNGNVKIKDKPELSAQYFSPAKSLASSLDLLSENRKEEGLATEMSITANITLSALAKEGKLGFLNLKKELKHATDLCANVSVKCRDALQKISDLSGGNQQKVALARLLNHNSDILFMDEPTRGIDVGSKAEIYRLMMELAKEGKSIVMVSSYLPELLGVCDSIAVMHRGTMSEVKPKAEWTEHSIMLYATSGG